MELLDSDSEEEEGKGEDKAEVKEEPKPAKEEIKVEEWACEICTLLNPIDTASCGVCGDGKRPSMEILIARVRDQRLEEAQ